MIINPSTHKNYSILVVDDVPENIDVMVGVLSKDYKVLCATRGEKALRIVHSKHPPDIILLDVMMPEMDGLEVCRRLKSDPKTTDIPVIFVTAKDEESDEAKGLEFGAVDYISKPIKPDVVLSRIKTHLKIQTLMKKINHANQKMINEQLVAKQIYDNIVHTDHLNQDYIQYSVTPMDIFCGDLLLSAKSPSGNLFIMLGDFTGHGLTAALGVIPTADIFYTMVENGFSLAKIIMELNRKLNASLPMGIFCAACVIEYDMRNQQLFIWNGWNPDIYLVTEDCKIKQTIETHHLAFGLAKPEEFDSETILVPFVPGEKLYVYSDGLTETLNDEKKLFGNEGIIKAIEQSPNNQDIFKNILDSSNQFRGQGDATDDVTLIEITAKAYKPN